MEWYRFLLGQASPWMLLEICGRAAVLYCMLMYCMRLLGRRVVSQYTLFELSIVVTLAGAIGIPLQAQERGLLPPLIILLVLVSIQRVVVAISIGHPGFAAAVSGAPERVVYQGVLVLPALKHAGLSREKLFALLRDYEIQHLGQISQAYLEPSGKLTLVRAQQPPPGLSILPRIDQALRREAAVASVACCASCGHRQGAEPPARCPVCGGREWETGARELQG